MSAILAQGPNPPVGIYNPALKFQVGQGSGTAIINLILGNLIGLILIGGVLISLAYAIAGAIEYMMAEGEEAKIKNARNKIAGAFIGLVFLFSLFAIIKLIGNLIGLTDLGNLNLDLSPFFIF